MAGSMAVGGGHLECDGGGMHVMRKITKTEERGLVGH